MPEPAANGSGPAALAGVLAGLLAFLLVVLVVVRWGADQPRAAPAATAPAGAPNEPEEEPDVLGPVTTPDAPPAAEPAVPGPTEREPTDADASTFTASYEPPGGRDVEAVVVDLDGDGRPEIVVASVAGDVVRLDVAVWGEDGYEVAHTDQGGPAEEITAFEVRDVTGDGTREIATSQSASDRRRSIAMWGWVEGRLERLAAQGGCWDGSHVYGHTGAEIITREIVATCEPVPDEVPAGTRDVYAWDGQVWRHDRTEGP